MAKTYAFDLGKISKGYILKNIYKTLIFRKNMGNEKKKIFIFFGKNYDF
jgi:hypothetical protein